MIGLEVHVELNTKTKMFCACRADYFGKEPNTHTCPVCLGLPGALPFINEQAIESCMKIGLALNCSINKKTLFERKNYFYPDLPKGYQISQLRWPLCINGSIEVVGADGKTSNIRINRAHQEEDTGKLSHRSGETFIDYNRSGVPLVEIVTEPDFTDTTQIKDYAKKLQQIFRYLGVSNADMERGDMRLEANVSVRQITDDRLQMTDQELPPYRVELKNINSFRFMAQAVEYEIKRQTEALERGERLVQETRGWNEEKKETFLQRSKEEANDYRYFPEPDLSELEIAESTIKSLEDSMPELPMKKVVRFVAEYGIKTSDAEILVETKEAAEHFEKTVEVGKNRGIEPKNIANFIINKKVDIKKVLSEEVIDEILKSKEGKIDDELELKKVAQEVIAESEKLVNDYKSGKENAIMALVGGVMRKTQGKADAEKAREVFKELLKS